MVICNHFLNLFISFSVFVSPSLQICLEEITGNGLNFRWPEVAEATNIKSDPLCYYKDVIISRDCVNNTWIPASSELPPCFDALRISDIPQSSVCPANFKQVSKNDALYCYKIENKSSWSFPCQSGGGASVITNLSDSYVESILSSLMKTNVSRYFWLPGRRATLFSPLIWYTPGQMWGRNVESHSLLPLRDCIFKNCLLLDIVAREIISELCWFEYPSLCLYKNNIHFPAKCPENYHGVRFSPHESICAGIEIINKNMTFENFSNMYKHQCTPMGDEIETDFSRYVYKEIAKNYILADDTWCWFSTSIYKQVKDQIDIFKSFFSDFQVSINKEGSIRLSKKSDSQKLFCLACRTQILYEQPELIFEYNDKDNKMYLTIYYPSGLWKYSADDKGFQCFSDAKGFVNVIDINKLPYMQVSNIELNENKNFTFEKIVYKIDPITERSAQYWCEGHTNNFTLISTDKVIANPHDSDIHVFSLAIEVFLTDDEIRIELNEKMNQVCENVTLIFNADKVLLMKILTYASETLLVLLHLHMPIVNIHAEMAENIQALYENMEEIAKSELNKYYTFVNISSSRFCLPTISNSDGSDEMTLEWELTAIGHIAAPKQFCLQANGLPVKRRCLGSYILGSKWGPVEGVCNKNYSPTNATTYLYNFYKGHMPKQATFEFLTNGLGDILNDIGGFIPADIFYLSISLQHIVNIAQNNESAIDMGSLENIAWIMNRVMILDNKYLRLSQTLNSTNVILDAVGEIINKLAEINTFLLLKNLNISYNLVKQPQFLIQICYPSFNNISGIAVKYNTHSNDFIDMDIIPLYKNTTYEDVLLIPNLDIATWIPEKVLNSLISDSTNNETLNENDLRVIISIFHNDAVFQALDPTTFHLNSRVVGVTIPGFLPNLLHPIPLVFRNLNNFEYEKHCGYWDFTVNNKMSGFWSNKGCYLVNIVNKTSVCNCYHLTHFGQLINIRERVILDEEPKNNIKPLNIISLTGSFLSLLGITGIWVTAFVFRVWRKKAGSKVLLNLTAAIAIPLIVMIVFNLGESIFRDYKGIFFESVHIKVKCILFGATLHYSVLASFMWMLITATLQFIRYVRVLGVNRPSRFMIKFTLVGWGIPILPVAFVLIVDSENYIPLSSASRNEFSICYPTGFYLLVTVIVPICIILFINITLFISVLYAISHGPDGKMRSTDVDLIGAQLRLSILLFFLLGLTWIFGIFSFTTNLIWSYFFCLTSTLQGFVLFVYFVICDPVTRSLWVNLMKPQFRQSTSTISPRESVTTISET